MYDYVANNPINLSDPSGLEPLKGGISKNQGKLPVPSGGPSKCNGPASQIPGYPGPAFGNRNDGGDSTLDYGLSGFAAPPGVDIRKNIRDAENHPADYWWFYNQMRNGGPWDYKQQGTQYQSFGNYNYGATAAASSIPLDIALRAAGWAQQQAGTSQSEWSSPLGTAPYGDDPIDQAIIRQGYNDYGIFGR